jgi:hypothetical protein
VRARRRGLAAPLGLCGPLQHLRADPRRPLRLHRKADEDRPRERSLPEPNQRPW